MFLDEKIFIEFREILDTPLFKEDKKYIDQYNLYCAVCYRIFDSVKYLNGNCSVPAKEHDFLVFMMYSCMLVDAVYILFDSAGMISEYESYDGKNIFKPFCMQYPLNLTEEECPADNEFFQYFRSLSFAQPFETSRAKFLSAKERHYSPEVIAYNPIANLMHTEQAVGVQIYSNKFDEIKDLRIPFRALKEYIASKFNLITVISDKLKDIILQFNEQCKKHKVNRYGGSELVLKNIIDILKERYITGYYYERIEELLFFISTEYTCPDNQWLVEEYKKDIDAIIPDLCNHIDELDYEKADKLLNDFLYPPVINMPYFAGYELAEIITFLNDKASVEFHDRGIRNAESFYKSFAQKWVYIDITSMSDDEIKALVNLALYKEAKETRKLKN